VVELRSSALRGRGSAAREQLGGLFLRQLAQLGEQGVFEGLCDAFDGAVVEECSDGEVDFGGCAESGDDFDGEQGVSAEGEEVVEGADVGGGEYVGVDLGDEDLGVGAGCDQCGGAFGCGEGGAVDFAAGGEG
jgi:hypothetical protein